MIIVIEDVSNPAENSVIKFPINLSWVNNILCCLASMVLQEFAQKALGSMLFHFITINIKHQSTSRFAELFMFLPEIEDSCLSIIF